LSRKTQVSCYQNVSILDFIGAKDVGGSGGDNWSCKANLQSNHHPPRNWHPAFYRLNALPAAQPTVSQYWRKILVFNQSNVK